MSSREKPYRSKATVIFFELVQSALASTFFLVHESGPTSFALKDEQGKVFKISLGSNHSCSCGGGRSEHCIHTLYVLLKIFRIQPDNPIIWQLSLIDSEINWLLRNRMNPFIEKKVKRSETASVARISLNEEFGCPICQEDLKDLDTLVYCKVGCGHNFHVKCMKVWAEFKVTQKDKITCPLCRNDWGNNVLAELIRLLRKKTKKPQQIHSNSVCINCEASPIAGVKYHCVVCPDFDLCGKCFKKTHKEHPFIKKQTPSSQWESEPKINSEMLLNRDFAPEDYELLSQLDTKPCLSEFLFSILPDTSPGVCYICKTDQPAGWKKLACGHVAHDVKII